MSALFRIFAATPDGPAELTPTAGARELNDAFDGLPLGIYEGLRTIHGPRVVALPEHLARAERSLRRLGWPYELDRQSLCTCLAETLADVAEGDSRLRFDVLTQDIDTPLGATRLVFGLTPLTLPPPTAYRDGVGVRVLRELEREDPLIKHASFVAARRRFPLDGAEAFERLLVDSSDRLLECTASSFFGVRGDTIYTASEGVLEGVTASQAIRLALEEGCEQSPRAMSTDDLATLDEAFLTSSIKGIVPVVRADEEPIGVGSPGPVTHRLIRRYEDWLEREARPAMDALSSDRS